MRGSYHAFVLRKSREAYEARRLKEQAGVTAALEALSEEAAELKRARIMNRCEPGYERKDGKL